MIVRNGLVQTSSTMDLGITVTIIYVMIFMYAYLNAFYKENGKLGLSIINPKKGITITNAMFNSEKIGVIIFLIMFTSITLHILTNQNFYKSTEGIVSMILIVCFSLMLVGFMFVDSKRIYLHTTMVFAMFMFCQLFGFITVSLYDESYPNQNIEEITTLTYVLTSIFTLISIMLIVNGYFYYQSKNKLISNIGLIGRLIMDIIGVSEIIYIIFFGILIYYISIYPPLV